MGKMKRQKTRIVAKKQNPFKLKEFRGINPLHVKKLEEHGIRNAGQMLEAGCNRKKRAVLASKTGIAPEVILELVKLSDLSRLPGVKGIRARLYYDAGVDSVEVMAGWDPEALRLKMIEHVKQTGFEGIPPLPKEVESTIANARMLPKILEE